MATEKEKTVRVEIKRHTLTLWQQVKRLSKRESWPSVARFLADYWLDRNDPYRKKRNG